MDTAKIMTTEGRGSKERVRKHAAGDYGSGQKTQLRKKLLLTDQCLATMRGERNLEHKEAKGVLDGTYADEEGDEVHLKCAHCVKRNDNKGEEAETKTHHRKRGRDAASLDSHCTNRSEEDSHYWTKLYALRMSFLIRLSVATKSVRCPRCVSRASSSVP